MVVVEMTSENPSYRYSEGGVFSFIMDNNIIFDKPFKTYEELIANLINKKPPLCYQHKDGHEGFYIPLHIARLATNEPYARNQYGHSFQDYCSEEYSNTLI